MFFHRLARAIARVEWERLVFLLALLSLFQLVRYLPTPANKSRLLQEEFEAAVLPLTQGDAELSTRTIAEFIVKHPKSKHEAAGRVELARAWRQLAKLRPDHSDEYLKHAFEQAGLALAAGADAANARAVQLDIAAELIAEGHVEHTIDVLETLRDHHVLPAERLLDLARAYLRRVPPLPTRALDRIAEFLDQPVDAASALRVDALLLRAQAREIAGQPAEVVAALEEALVAAAGLPRIHEVRLALGRAHFGAGNLAAARAALAPLSADEAAGSLRHEAEYWQGRIDLAEDRVHDGIARFREVIASSPAPALHFAVGVFLASAYRRLHELRSAYSWLEQVVADLPRLDLQRMPLLTLNEFLEECRLLADLSDLRDLLAQGVRLNQSAAAALPRAARGVFHDLHAACAERLSELLADRAQNPPPGQNPEETADLQRQSRELLITAAHARWARGELREPILIPGRPAFQAGVDFHQAGEMLRAVRALRSYLHDCMFEDPLQPRALYLLGTAYQRLGEFDQALDAHRRNMFQFPRVFPDAYLSRREMGACYEAKKDWASAELAYRDVLESQDLSWTHPVWRASLARLGEVHYRQALAALARGAQQPAEEALQRAIRRLDEFQRRYPDQEAELVSVLRTLGVCYLRTKDWQRAAEVFAQAVAIGQPGRLTRKQRVEAEEIDLAVRESALLWADALYLSGDLDRALTRYEDYRLRFATGRAQLWVLRQLERCQQRRGDARESARYRELFELAQKKLEQEQGPEGGDVTAGLPAEFWTELAR